jgi:hypothetical protein
MKTNDINLNKHVAQLLSLVSDLQSQESDFYKKALLKRIELNVKATNTLVESNYLLDACALVRISVDHCCRLFQYVFNPESITNGRNKSAFQILGHGPGTGYTFKALRSQADFGLLYSVLCAFVHPDLLGLILSITEDDKNTILYKVVISMGILTTIFILLDLQMEEGANIKKDISKEAESIMIVFLGAIIDNISSENLSGLKDIPLVNELFANQTINEHIREFIETVKEGPEKVEELLNGLFVNR